MSSTVMRKVIQTEGFELAAAVDLQKSQVFGQDTGIVSGLAPTGQTIISPDDYFRAPEEGPGDGTYGRKWNHGSQPGTT